MDTTTTNDATQKENLPVAKVDSPELKTPQDPAPVQEKLAATAAPSAPVPKIEAAVHHAPVAPKIRTPLTQQAINKRLGWVSGISLAIAVVAVFMAMKASSVGNKALTTSESKADKSDIQAALTNPALNNGGNQMGQNGQMGNNGYQQQGGQMNPNQNQMGQNQMGNNSNQMPNNTNGNGYNNNSGSSSGTTSGYDSASGNGAGNSNNNYRNNNNSSRRRSNQRNNQNKNGLGDNNGINDIQPNAAQ